MRTHMHKSHSLLFLGGKVRHELVHCSKERVVVVLVVAVSGKSVIAVGARGTDVRANEVLVVRECCVPFVE